MASEGGKRTIGADFFRAWSIDRLAAQSDEWLDAQGRLVQPLYRREGAAYYEPVSWDEAFRHVGKVLRALPMRTMPPSTLRSRVRPPFYQLLSGGSAPTTCPTAPT
jgi:hypothetical protein